MISATVRSTRPFTSTAVNTLSSLSSVLCRKISRYSPVACPVWVNTAPDLESSPGFSGAPVRTSTHCASNFPVRFPSSRTLLGDPAAAPADTIATVSAELLLFKTARLRPPEVTHFRVRSPPPPRARGRPPRAPPRHNRHRVRRITAVEPLDLPRRRAF